MERQEDYLIRLDPFGLEDLLLPWRRTSPDHSDRSSRVYLLCQRRARQHARICRPRPSLVSSILKQNRGFPWFSWEKGAVAWMILDFVSSTSRFCGCTEGDCSSTLFSFVPKPQEKQHRCFQWSASRSSHVGLALYFPSWPADCLS